MISNWRRVVTTVALVAALGCVAALSACNGETKEEHTGTPGLIQVRRQIITDPPVDPPPPPALVAAVYDNGDGSGTIVYDNSLWPIQPSDMTEDMGPANPGDLCEAFGGEMSEPYHGTWEGDYNAPIGAEACPPK